MNEKLTMEQMQLIGDAMVITDSMRRTASAISHCADGKKRAEKFLKGARPAVKRITDDLFTRAENISKTEK